MYQKTNEQISRCGQGVSAEDLYAICTQLWNSTQDSKRSFRMQEWLNCHSEVNFGNIIETVYIYIYIYMKC